MGADLNVFDPSTVGPAVPELVDDLPAGGRRLEQRSHGFLATLVDGEVTIRRRSADRRDARVDCCVVGVSDPRAATPHRIHSVVEWRRAMTHRPWWRTQRSR